MAIIIWSKEKKMFLGHSNNILNGEEPSDENWVKRWKLYRNENIDSNDWFFK